MAILNIPINGRNHQIACDDGQEAHLTGLGRELDGMVQELAVSMGSQVSDGTLLTLNSLMLLDELHELREQTRNLKMQLSNNAQAFESEKHIELETAIAEAYDDAAARIAALSRAIG